MPLTAVQATTQLADITTADQLRTLIAQIDTSATGATTVFYSGSLPNGGGSDSVVRELALQDPSLRIIDKTEAARFLNLQNNQALFDKLVELVGGNPNTPGTPSNQFLFGTYDVGGTRITADGVWDDVSGRFAAATTGDVRVVAYRAEPSKIFGATELPALLRNTAITSIEGIPLSELRATEAMYGTGGLDAVFSRVRATSEFNIAAGGLTATQLPAGGGVAVHAGDFLDPQLLDTQAYLIHHPEAHARIDGYINALSEADLAERRTVAQALRSTNEGTRLSGGARVLNKLGVFGSLFGFALAANAAEEAHAAGDTARAKEIMKEWAVDAAGSEVGSLIGAAVGGVAVAAAAVAGVTLAAPLAGALVLGGALIGGIFGAEGAVEFYRQLDDRDGNGKRDVMDRLSNLLFGATSTLTTPLPADLNGARYTIDASLTRDEIVANARTSIAWRYALRELNGFVVTDVAYDRHNTDGSLDLYDPATGQGAMTERFLADRAAMLTWKLQFERDGARDADDAPRNGSKPYNEDWDSNAIRGNWDFVDLTVRQPGGQPLTLAIDGTGLSLHDHQVVFGSAQGETIQGEGGSDWLYGMSGNDTVLGRDGDDYLEGGVGDDSLDGGNGNDELLGGTGDDRYAFSGTWGIDTINDRDGSIRVDGNALPQLKRVGAGVYQDASGTVTATPVPGRTGEKDLVLTFAQSTGHAEDKIILRNWRPGELGITPDEQIAPLQTDHTVTGDDAANELSWAHDSGPGIDTGTLIGRGGNDTLKGWEDGVGDMLRTPPADYTQFGDELDGGMGDDVLFAGEGHDVLSGGAGDDYLLGGTREYEPGWWAGFGLDESQPEVFIDASFGAARREADWNVMDGGAGDDVIFGGWGADTLVVAGTRSVSSKAANVDTWRACA